MCSASEQIILLADQRGLDNDFSHGPKLSHKNMLLESLKIPSILNLPRFACFFFFLPNSVSMQDALNSENTENTHKLHQGKTLNNAW